MNKCNINSQIKDLLCKKIGYNNHFYFYCTFHKGKDATTGAKTKEFQKKESTQ